eukprot:scaffold30447_cov160-Skeletonema_menzelii.AAC.1
MGLRRNCAAVQDAQIRRGTEECALSMGLSPNDAAVQDLPIKFRKEECFNAKAEEESARLLKEIVELQLGLSPIQE